MSAIATTQSSSANILPSTSALNPIPTLTSALRIDNQDQLMEFLLSSSDYHDPKSGVTAVGSEKVKVSSSSSFNDKHLFVFGTSSLRTLIMRQVLSNPDSLASKSLLSKGNPSNKKKNNWDPLSSYPDIPKGLNVVGTRVLKSSRDSAATSEISINPSSTMSVENLWRLDGLDNIDVDVITYFLRPNDLEQTQNAMMHFKYWAEQSNKSSRKRRQLHHRFLYLPQVTAMVQKIHDDIGLTATTLGSTGTTVSIHSLQLDLFPLETDVISLEYENALREDVVEETSSFLISTCARSIQKLQDIVGPIQRIQTYGPMAEDILTKLLDITVDEFLQKAPDDVIYDDDDDENASFVEAGAVVAMIIMDRKVDLVTPLVTTLTYEGLIDHIFGIDSGYIAVNLNTINPDGSTDEGSMASSGSKQSANASSSAIVTSESEKFVALGVNGSDSLYAEVRNHHVEKFGSFLQNQAKALQQSHANFTDKNKKKELSEIHQFVKQMPMFTQNLRSLTNHIHLAELIKRTSEEVSFREHWQLERSILEGEVCYEQIEDLIAMQYSPYNLFRLLCLQSLCCGGIKSSKYDTIKRDIIQAYGYEYMFLLTNLEKSGLLRRRDGLWGTIDTSSISSSSYNNVLRKSLILINAEVDTSEPDDISYVSSGYAPISIRILQTATIKGWIGRQDILRELPGKHYDVMQMYPPQDLSTLVNNKKLQIRKASLAAQVGKTAAADPITKLAKKHVLMLFFVGGVTYMEIAALRFLSKRSTFPYHIICVTTKIINGFTMLQSLR